jgi:hypothetical protein
MMQLLSAANDATIIHMMQLFSIWSDYFPNDATIIPDSIHLRLTIMIV